MPKDFQPRANIKKMFSDGMLTTEEELQQFLEKFAVEPHLIKAYIAHLEDLKIQSGIRTRGRAEQKRKIIVSRICLARSCRVWRFKKVACI